MIPTSGLSKVDHGGRLDSSDQYTRNPLSRPLRQTVPVFEGVSVSLYTIFSDLGAKYMCRLACVCHIRAVCVFLVFAVSDESIQRFALKNGLVGTSSRWLKITRNTHIPLWSCFGEIVDELTA